MGAFLGSRLTEISGRFSGHVQEIREFLLKEKLPVDSPEAIAQLSRRLGTDARFRGDLASLMRAVLYEEREGIGYEDLLGILVTAAAGTEHDLKSEAQEADIREMLRFLLQSRRSSFQPEQEPEETPAAVESERPVFVPQDPEPVLRARTPQSTSSSMKLELKPEEPPAPVAEVRRREEKDVVLPGFAAGGLFASHIEPEDSWWRAHAVWVVGVICLLAGIGLGFVFHRVVSAAETQVAMRVAKSPDKPKPTGSVPPPETVATNAPVAAAETGQTAQVADDQEPAQPAAAHVEPVAAVAAPEKTSGVPMTVVRQVVTASRGGAADSAQSTARTRAFVPQGVAGITPANVVFSPAPAYPANAAAARVHGQVTVHAVVDPDGKVIYARAVSGPPLLRDAAEEAVHRWRYRPLLDNGKPIAVTTTAIVDFKFAR